MDDISCHTPTIPVSPRMLASLCTVIARDTALGCEIDSALPVYVAGRVAGVEAPVVTVAQDAGIAGTVTAVEVFIDGCIGGCVHGDIVSLGPAARVVGDVVCRKLYAAPGAHIGGRTHPSMRLTRKHAAGLARIARSRRAVEKIDPEVLDMLLREGLVFRRGNAVFVSLFGHLELGRRWTRYIGGMPGFHASMRGIDAYPAALRLAHEVTSNGNALLTVIADDVTVAGDIRTKGHLHLSGDVTGDVSARSLFVGDCARVSGSVRAKEVSLWGEVVENLSAQKIILHTTACVGGMVAFGTIDVRGGACYASARQVWHDSQNDLVSLAPFRDTAVEIESAISDVRAAA